MNTVKWGFSLLLENAYIFMNKTHLYIRTQIREGCERYGVLNVCLQIKMKRNLN